MCRMKDTSGLPARQTPRPAQRIGDAERDAAVERLQTNHAEGRLTVQEFDERMTLALAARTQDDLAPLFSDLPDEDDRTSFAEAAPVDLADDEVPPRKRGGHYLPPDEPGWVNALRLASWAAFPLAIFCLIVFGTFWPMLVAIFLAPSGHALADSLRRRHLEARRARGELPHRPTSRRDLP